MTGSEDALLARLSALRKAHLDLSDAPSSPQAVSTPKAAASPARAADTSDIDLDLAARFRNLTPSATSTPQKSFVGADYGFEEEDTPHNDEDEQTLEELLQELGPDEQWMLDPDDPKHISQLLEEARTALPREQRAADADVVDGVKSELAQAAADSQKELDIEIGHQQPSPPGREGGDDGDDEETRKTVDQQDDEEADSYVSQVLAQLDLERKYGGASPPEAPSDDDDTGANKDVTPGSPTKDLGGALSLPSAPTGVPSSPAQDLDTDIDSALSARFASLGGLGLPSVPSFSPSKKPINVTKSLKSNLPKYTDEDIDSWCCICNEDATVRCLGCDYDLYCDGCWKEGHGTEPGQERGHRAVRYTRDRRGQTKVGA
ncbi:hypothetical protein MBLNU459_g4357t1 [Dothideomycetes sp. NU459]